MENLNDTEHYGYEGDMTPLKCDELKAYKADVTIPVYGTIADAEVYLKDKADAALSEKDKEIARQNIEIKEAVQTMKSLEAEIIELKDKCQMHDFFWEGCGFKKRGFKNTIAVSEAFDRLEAENAELKQKLEDVQASMYADVVDANMENRRLKRALWLARANRALEKIAWFKLWNASISTMNPEDGARQEFDKWKRNLGKFLKKAEEYK